MIALNDFYNDGFGWMCRHCEPVRNRGSLSSPGLGRFFHEGEAESKSPVLSNKALAKWADPAHRVLSCPTCGITELVDKR